MIDLIDLIDTSVPVTMMIVMSVFVVLCSCDDI